MATDNRYGGTVENLRKKMGWSQTDLTSELLLVGDFHWSQALVSRIERNDSAIRAERLLDLCEVFAVTPHEFLGYDTSAAMTAIIRDAALGQAIRRVVRDEVAP